MSHPSNISHPSNMSYLIPNSRVEILEQYREAERNSASWRTWGYFSTLITGITSLTFATAASMGPGELTGIRMIWLSVSFMTMGVGMLGLSQVVTVNNSRRTTGSLLMGVDEDDIEMQGFGPRLD